MAKIINNVICVVCGKPFHLKPSQLKKAAHHACSAKCKKEQCRRRMTGAGNHQYGLRGDKNASFKGEFITKRNNAQVDTWAYVPEHPHANKGGRVKLHRYIVEQHADRFDPKYFEQVDGVTVLKKTSFVHHIDGDHFNNNVDNLMPVTMAEHTLIHNLMDPRARDKETGRFTHGDGLTVEYCVFDKKNGLPPFHGTECSAGYDLHIARYEETETTIKYWFGIGIKIPDGYYGLMVARSSMWKMGQRLASSACVIDSDFVGELSAVFEKGPGFKRLNVGDRPVQIVLQKHLYAKFIETDALEQTARGTGGYGSTGV